MSSINQLVLDENNIAFYPMMGNSYKLNDIGSAILKLLQQGKSVDEIISELSESYDVSRSQLFIDISDFTTKLKIYGLM